MALKEEARSTAQQKMAALAQGSYSAANSLTQHLRASSLLLGASTAAAAGGVGVLHDKLRRLHEVRPPCAPAASAEVARAALVSEVVRRRAHLTRIRRLQLLE